jgi:hypothetical protein
LKSFSASSIETLKRFPLIYAIMNGQLRAGDLTDEQSYELRDEFARLSRIMPAGEWELVSERIGAL